MLSLMVFNKLLHLYYIYITTTQDIEHFFYPRISPTSCPISTVSELAALGSPENF